MDTPQLDDFLGALQSALLSARRSLLQRQRALLEQYCERDEQGKLRSKTLNFSLPRGIAGDGYQTLTLPLLGLLSPHRPQLAEFTLSFECEFTPLRHARGSAPRYKMRLAGKHRWWWRPALHRVVIRFRTGEGQAGQVTIDGIPFKEIPPPSGGAA